ncbi:MAG: glycoside hydrolase family 13 protein [Flavobacteriaceae bacterium]
MKKFVFFLIWVGLSQLTYGQVQKVEPPFWWEGMKDATLMITLYGDDLSSYTITSENLTVSKVVHLESPNYAFVYLDLTNTTVGLHELTLHHDTKPAISVPYEIHTRRAGSAMRKGFDSSDFIYLIMPDRFANGDPNNDAHPDLADKPNRNDPWARHGGDLQGIIDNLDYIEDLGVTAIWNTPVVEDNDPKGSYHMYAASDVYQIDRRFGSNQTYKHLSEALKKRNMKLIMDYVVNHWSLEHYMIKDLPSSDWINQWEEFTPSSHAKEIFSDPYASEIDKKEMVKGWFVESMPDLNQQQPQLLKYLIQNAIWWVEYADLSGFRVDTYPYNSRDEVTQWSKAIMDEYPHFSIVAESWLMNPLHLSYWQKDSPIAAMSGFNSQVTHVKDFALYNAIHEAFVGETPWWDQKMNKIYKVIQNDFVYATPNNLMVFLENHDTTRINEILTDFRDYQIVTTLMATIRGVPQTYYGTEIGMKGAKEKGDADLRRDFPGGWPEDPRNAFTKTGRTQIENQYYDFTSKLFQWRKNEAVIHHGKTLHYSPKNEVYVYFRYTDEKSIMVILNANKEAQTIDFGRFSERIGDTPNGKDVFHKEDVLFSKPLTLPAKSTKIISFKTP